MFRRCESPGPDLVDGPGANPFTALEFISGVGLFTDDPEVLDQVLVEAEVAVFRPSNFVLLADHPNLRVANLRLFFPLRCRRDRRAELSPI